MADVQVEHGHTRIANRLLEALIEAPFSAVQYQLVLTLVRMTYGWQRSEITISLRELVARMGPQQRVTSWLYEEWQKLVREGVVRITAPGGGAYANTVALNKDFETWGRYSVAEGRLVAAWNEPPPRRAAAPAAPPAAPPPPPTTPPAYGASPHSTSPAYGEGGSPYAGEGEGLNPLPDPALRGAQRKGKDNAAAAGSSSARGGTAGSSNGTTGDGAAADGAAAASPPPPARLPTKRMLRTYPALAAWAEGNEARVMAFRRLLARVRDEAQLSDAPAYAAVVAAVLEGDGGPGVTPEQLHMNLLDYTTKRDDTGRLPRLDTRAMRAFLYGRDTGKGTAPRPRAGASSGASSSSGNGAGSGKLPTL